MRQKTEQDFYQKAFAAYLRRGVPLTVSLKAEAERSPDHYIWRKRGDDRVRPSHAANNGKLFSFDDPPPTGNPGEDFGCRCWAEPYVQGKTEYVEQNLNPTESEERKWYLADFLRHFYLGEGAAITLAEAGRLSELIDYYFYRIFREGSHTYDRVNAQIITRAREQGVGDIVYDFLNSYKEFGDYYWPFGTATVKGNFEGSMRAEGEMLFIGGVVEYRFIDTFTDIFDLRQILIGTSEPLEPWLLGLFLSDFPGVFYDIIGTWSTRFHAEIRRNPEESAYP